MKKKGNAEKESFRKTNVWKNFRESLLQKRGAVCECCGTKTKNLQLHHMDEKNYTDLNPDKFVFLCSMCHKCVSRLERIKPENWYKYNPLWVAFFSRFLIPPLNNYENRFNNK